MAGQTRLGAGGRQLNEEDRETQREREGQPWWHRARWCEKSGSNKWAWAKVPTEAGKGPTDRGLPY